MTRAWRTVRRQVRRVRWMVGLARRGDLDDAPAVAWGYLKLSVLAAVRPRWRRPVRLLGYTVHHADLATLRYLFKEIFIDQDYLVPRDVVVREIVDAGANVGLATLWFRRTFPDARVVCFEPDPRAFECLRRNVEDNRVAGVTLHNLGLGEEARDATLYVDPNVENSCQSMSPEFARSLLGQARPDEIPVRIAALRDHMPDHVDLLKLDVEGFELAVLRGAGERLRDVDRIVMEYHNVPESPLHDVLATLAAAGHRYELRSPLRAHLGAVTTIRSAAGSALLQE